MTTQNSQVDVRFLSNAISNDDEFLLREVDGRERISRLFEFSIIVDTRTQFALDQLTLNELMSQQSCFVFGENSEFPVWGVVRAVETSAIDDDRDTVSYRFTLVPRMWNATQVVRSSIFQGENVIDITKKLLKENGLADDDMDWTKVTASKHPKRDYIVQYQETDFNFICRLLEHEGIYFYFRHETDRDVVVFGDTNAGFYKHTGEGLTDAFRYERRGATRAGEVITSLSRREHTLPSSVELRDYNYRTASVKQQAEAKVDKEFGAGDVTLYGEHFTSPNDGKRMANMRAEELISHKVEFTGISRIRGLHPGLKFKLENHPVPDEYEIDYLVTEVIHSIRQSGAGAANASGGPAQGLGQGAGYENRFVALPDLAAKQSIHFRPQRTTPKPRIYGFTHAKIDGEENGMAAPIDPEGRYKVIFPWDTKSKKPGGHSTRWIRRVQMANGPDFGMHLPLHVGTEVMIAHLDGDPDRPVIVGSVPNSDVPSPVNQANATQAIFRTKAAISLIFEDDQ